MPATRFASRQQIILLFATVGLLVSLLCLSFSFLTHLNLIELLSLQSYAWLFPLVGLLAVALIEKRWAEHSKVGIIQVIHSYHFDKKPLRWPELGYQFSCGLILVWSGFAVGMVGPSCFMAALLSKRLALHFTRRRSEVRTAMACGVAAAVAALFNAPIAGTVIAYELVMRHFKWTSITSVAFCAFVASIVSTALGGSMLKVDLPELSHAPADWPWFLLLGLGCGLLAALLILLVKHVPRLPRHQLLIFVALFTALAGYWNPDWLGLEPITPNEMLAWDITSTEQALWLASRFVLTGIVIAVALPGGTLGPMLVLGGILGSLLGSLFGGELQQMFIVCGMAAMFGAVFRTPLAAFFLITEQTLQLPLVLPAFIACASASWLTQHFYRSPSLINLQLVRAGIFLSRSPILRARLKGMPKRRKLLDRLNKTSK